MTQTNNSFIWKVLSFRLTAFLTEGPNLDPTKLWIEAVGDEPDEEQNRPRSGEFVRVGQTEGMRLRLLGQPGRVDWFVEVNVQDGVERPEPLTLSALPWSPAHELISRVTQRLLSEANISITRLAFGAILVQPVEDVRSGYLALASHLDAVKIDPDHSSDFLYQINRPRQSKFMPSLAINRLSKWAVMSQGEIRFRLSLEREGGTTAGHATTDLFAHAVRLELDINTISDKQNVLPQNQLTSIFEELVSLGLEIAGKGDIA